MNTPILSPTQPIHDPHDDQWIREHMEELVDNYAGKYVAVANQEIAGADARAVNAERAAKEKYPQIAPSIFRVPRPDDFVCAL